MLTSITLLRHVGFFGWRIHGAVCHVCAQSAYIAQSTMYAPPGENLTVPSSDEEGKWCVATRGWSDGSTCDPDSSVSCRGREFCGTKRLIEGFCNEQSHHPGDGCAIARPSSAEEGSKMSKSPERSNTLTQLFESSIQTF